MKKNLILCSLLALLMIGCAPNDTSNDASSPAATQVNAIDFGENAPTIVGAETAARQSDLTETDVPSAGDQLLVTFPEDVTSADIQAVQTILNQLGGAVVGEVPEAHTIQVQFPAGTDLSAAETALASVPGLSVSLDMEIVPEQSIRNPIPSSFVGNYWIPQIRAEQGWAMINTAGTWPKIGILDGGIEPNAGFLSPNRLKAILTPAGTRISSPTDYDFHGTTVASFAAGDGSGDAPSTCGVAWKSPLVIVKVIGGSGADYNLKNGAAIITAVNNGARVLNLSYGPNTIFARTDDDVYRAYEKFRLGENGGLLYARRRDVVVCFAAGNDGRKNDNLFLPAGNVDTVWRTHALNVGSSNIQNAMSTSSTEGASVHLAAPGEDVSVGRPLPPNGAATTQGTSFSSPLVAGTIASLLNIKPDLMGCEARQIVLDTLASNLYPFGNRLRQLDFGAAAREASFMPAKATPLEITLRLGSGRTVNVPKATVRILGDPEGFATATSPVILRGVMRQSVTRNTYPIMIWVSNGNNTPFLRQQVNITVPAEGQ